MKGLKALAPAATVAAGLLLVPAAGAAPASMSESYTAQAQISVSASPKMCDNTGSSIDLSQGIKFPGVGVALKFQNQAQNDNAHVKTTDPSLTGELSLQLTNTSTTQLPKQGANGTGGNPYIFLGVRHKPQNAPEWVEWDTSPIGRCVVGQSLKNSNKYVGVDATL
jgi:hypothetical protein